MMHTNKKAGPARPARNSQNDTTAHDNAAITLRIVRRIGQPGFTPNQAVTRRILQEATACGECGTAFNARLLAQAVIWLAHHSNVGEVHSAYPLCPACARKSTFPHCAEQAKLAARTLLLPAQGGAQ